MVGKTKKRKEGKKSEAKFSEQEKRKSNYLEIWKKMMELKERQERIHLCGM